MKKYTWLVAISLFLFTACDIIEGALNKPTKIYSQSELQKNIKKLQESEDYPTLEDMKFWDISVDFSYSDIESNCDMFAGYNLVDAEDKNKLVNQTYQSAYSSFRKAYHIQVVDGNGDEIKDYNLFKDNLFTISQLKQFDNLDKLMEQALAAVDKKDENNYIGRFSISCVPQIMYSFEVKNKKDRIYSYTVVFDDNGAKMD